MFRWLRSLVILVALLSLIETTFAQSSIEESAQENEAYYTISTNQKEGSPPPRLDPFEILTETVSEAFTVLSGNDLMAPARKLNLLKWVRHLGARETPIEAYNRLRHFGAWINDPFDDTCYNTRTKVLMRDSRTKVKFMPDHHCMVESGNWLDPYTGRKIVDPRQIQIDHVVPLKNAYVSGAWRWTTRKRCLYANFLANSHHLLPVDDHENMSKSDRGPDQYMPPNPRFTCEYLRNWLEIKLIWGLEMPAAEAESIRTQLRDRNCDMKMLLMNRGDYNLQRAATQRLQSSCTPKSNYEVDLQNEVESSY